MNNHIHLSKTPVYQSTILYHPKHRKYIQHIPLNPLLDKKTEVITKGYQKQTATYSLRSSKLKISHSLRYFLLIE